MLETDATVLRGVLDAMQDMLRVMDLTRHVVFNNASFLNCFGDQTGKLCHDIISANGSCINCVSKKAMETGKTQQKHKRLQNNIYLISASPIYNKNNNLVGTVEVFRDVTAQYAQQDALRIQNMRLLREANLAARMQRDLFLAQGVPDKRLVMDSRYLPASSLGGDMFGCILQEDGRFVFYIADVSGHGMAAAMITLLLANCLRGSKAKTAAELLYGAREAFLSMVRDDQIYVSMFVVLLDPATGVFYYANAGLNAAPYLKSGDEIITLYSPALPICNWQENIIYPEHKCKMEKGGSLLLYTDGLLDEKSTSLAEEELLEFMKKYNGDELLRNLERKVKQNHEDDVCMLLVTRQKQQNEG